MLADEVSDIVNFSWHATLHNVRRLFLGDDGLVDAPAPYVLNALQRRKGEWSGLGTVRVTRGRLVHERDPKRRRASVSTIEGIERDGEYLWVRRRRAHDWLIRFEDADDAERIEAEIRAAMESASGPTALGAVREP